MTDQRATIREVAAEAGVGISTVSKALNHGAGSDDVVRRVREAADRLGYRPSRQASGLRRGSSGVIGALIPDLANPVYVDYLRGVEAAARGRGRIVQVADGQGSPKVISALLRQLAADRVDGVVLAGRISAGARRRLGDAGVATVPDGGPADRAYEREWERTEAAATGDLAAHLLDLGHRRFAWAVLPGSVRAPAAFRAARFDAFARAVEARGARLDLCVVEGPPDGPGPAPAGLRTATAAISATLTTAPLLLAWLHRLGRRIGTDVSVATYGDSPWTRAVEPSLAVIRHDTFDEGRQAADALLDRLEGRPERPRIPPVAAFVERPSLGPPAARRARR